MRYVAGDILLMEVNMTQQIAIISILKGENCFVFFADEHIINWVISFSDEFKFVTDKACVAKWTLRHFQES